MPMNKIVAPASQARIPCYKKTIERITKVRPCANRLTAHVADYHRSDENHEEKVRRSVYGSLSDVPDDPMPSPKFSA
jgi:hypothetical protein